MMSLVYEFWLELVGNHLVLVPKVNIDLDWSIIGQIGQINFIKNLSYVTNYSFIFTDLSIFAFC